jgi:flavodoxin
MLDKNILIICHSIHHGNTMKVAEVIKEELKANIRTPFEVELNEIDKYDLIGFGSGIYNGKHHDSLFNLIKNLKIQENKKAFIFSTATISYKKMNDSLKQELISKGFDVIDEFICRGFMNYSFIKYFFGGLNKKRPNKKDLLNAKFFCIKMKNKL